MFDVLIFLFQIEFPNCRRGGNVYTRMHFDEDTTANNRIKIARVFSTYIKHCPSC